MDNDNQEDPKVDWTSYHESNTQPVDVGAFTALVRRVGGELTEIDNQSVSHSTKRALQIDKQKIVQELSSHAKSAPEAPVLPPIHTPSEDAQPVHASTPPVRVPPPPPPIHHDDSSDISARISAIEKKLVRMESFNKAYQKVRKIKRGSTY